VTDRPLQLGDVVHERANIGPKVFEGDGTVVEHVRSLRVRLRILGRPLEITYSFTASNGNTVFHRELDYPIEGFRGTAADPAAVERLMQQQSAEGLKKLQALVEDELTKEVAAQSDRQ
jgi:hypothetical protein